MCQGRKLINKRPGTSARAVFVSAFVSVPDTEVNFGLKNFDLTVPKVSGTKGTIISESLVLFSRIGCVTLWELKANR